MCKGNLLIVATTLLLLIAAATPIKPPVVTIIKNDGTTVRGQLDSADLKAVSVTQLIKNKPEGEHATVPWTDIKSVSNGLTLKRVIEQWKKEHPEDLCDVSHGSGKTTCPTCKGTGRDATSAKDCPACKGAEIVPCTTAKCDHGKIKCPKQHILREEGQWYSKNNGDGKMWRKFPNTTGGYWEISDGHLGQVFDPASGPVICPLCNGSMKTDDPKCHGTGSIPCPDCTKLAAKNKCPDCDKGQTSCKTCDGTGVKSLTKEQPQPPQPTS